MFKRPLATCTALAMCCMCAPAFAVASGCASNTPRPEPIALAAETPASQPASAPVFSLTPPPPDQPQPHFVCENPDLRLEPVWYGQEFTSVWHVSNTGTAPLTVQLIP
jgi:hypothetical protein